MTISVVISIFNESNTIVDCVESILKQNRLPEEILIVDNNCTDNSVEKIKNYPLIRVVQEKKQGIWPARHRGYDEAIGDILVCTDADARFETNWLLNIESDFANDKVVAVTGPGKFSSSNKLLNEYGKYTYMKAFYFTGWLAFTIKPLFGSNFAIRKSIWKNIRHEVHSKNDRVHDDMDLTYHLLGKGKIKFNKANYVYISTRTLTNHRRMITQYKKGFVTVFSHWPKYYPPVLYYKILTGKLIR